MKKRKIISIFLVAMLLVVNLNWAYGNDPVENIDEDGYFQKVQDLRKQQAEEIDLLNRKSQEEFPGENQRKFKPDEQIRVIVELEGRPMPYSSLRSGSDVEEAMEEQYRVIDEVNTDIDFETRHQFLQGFYGFSADTEFQNVAALEAQKNVKRVYIAERFTLDMSNSRKIINTQELVDLEGLYGDGTVIAIIDSGVDPNHKDWQELDDVHVKLTEETFNKIANRTGVEEVYYNSKVPTGYDWADDDNDVVGYRSDHGIHVAGTAAGNGKIHGIAPNAQVLAEKVFSDYDDYAYEDDIVAAILHAVDFGADVINMSLGSTAAFLDPDRPYHQAIAHAVDQGVVVSVSAGNSAFSTSPFLPLAENPDIGLVGSPGLWYDTIQVASYENDYVTSYFMEYGDDQRAQYTNSGPNAIIHFDKNAMEIEYAGLGGTEEHYAGKDFTGKIALIERGGYNFVDKISMAESHGAAGAIVYNNETDKDSLLSMAYPENGTIPAVFIGRTAGTNLLDILNDNGTAEVRFGGQYGEEANSNSHRMADSTSWGLTSDLAFKPEITAPGGNIWSLSNDNLFSNKGGTSMAAPHVAGGSALLTQYMRDKLNLSQNREAVELMKLLLMNTAEIIEDPDNEFLPFSPRRQGSGIMKLDKAVLTPAYLYTTIDDDNRIEGNERKTGAVTLRDDVTQEFELKLATVNEDELSVPYVVYSSVYTDVESKSLLTMKTEPVINAELKLLTSTGENDNTVTSIVYAESDKVNTLTFQLDLSEADLASESFVEGFIELVPLHAEYPALSIPYVGFYGDWNRPKTIDTAFWEDNTFTAYTGIYDNDLLNLYNSFGYTTDVVLDNIHPVVTLGYNMAEEFDKDAIAISPYTDHRDSAQAVFTILRNAKEFNLVIVDDKNHIVKELFDNKELTNPDGSKPFVEGLRKNVFASEILTQYPALFSWDGTDEEGNIVPEGQYYFKVTSKIHYDHIRSVNHQIYKMPVKVDLTPLKITNLRLEDNTVKWEAAGSDLYGFTIFVNGSIAGETMDNAITLEGISQQDSIVVVAEDIAGNMSLSYIGDYSNGDYGVIKDFKIDAQQGDNHINYQKQGLISAVSEIPVNWNVSVMDPNDLIVGQYQAVNTDNFSASWKPLDKHQPSGQYKVVFEAQYTIEQEGEPINNIERKELNFEVYNFEVQVTDLEVLNPEGEAVNSFHKNEMVQVKATVKGLGPVTVSPTIIIKVEDQQGKIISSGLAVVALEELANQEEATIRSFISIPHNAKKGPCLVKAYVWNGWTGEEIEALSTTSEASFTVE